MLIKAKIMTLESLEESFLQILEILDQFMWTHLENFRNSEKDQRTNTEI